MDSTFQGESQRGTNRGDRSVFKKVFVVVGFGVLVWAFCGALIAVGRQFLTMETTLLLHAAGAPIGAAVFAWIYYRRFAYTGPIATAAIFVATALGLDLLLVAPVFEKSYAMFSSVLGVWLPQALIFAATYMVGRMATRQDNFLTGFVSE